MGWQGLMRICRTREESVVVSVVKCRASQPKSSTQMRKPASFQKLSWSEMNSNSSPSTPREVEEFLQGSPGSNLEVFTMSEIKIITKNFRSDYMLGEGGFGAVHKGYIDDNVRHGSKGIAVAVKVLNPEGLQGHREWLAEVIFLGQLRHPHLVKLVGYCCEDEERVLVYEFMPRGSLENHLFRKVSVPLPWSARIKIAIGAAKGLAFLHGAENPVIYRDFKTSNILLDSDYTAKLSDFGLAKDGPEGDETHVSTRVMGTYGYAAPEYVMTGHLTARSDVYSFGVVLLELLTGRRAMDRTRPSREQNLADWARPFLNDKRKLVRIIDPRLEGQYSMKAAQKAASLAYNCLGQNPKARPLMKDVVEILEPLQNMKDMVGASFTYTASDGVTAYEVHSQLTENGSATNGYRTHSNIAPAVRYRSARLSSLGSESYKQSPRHPRKGA